jgi:hypothetical protein
MIYQLLIYGLAWLVTKFVAAVVVIVIVGLGG